MIHQTSIFPNIHKDLLDLSALSNNKGHRLVTTNMDRLFHKAGLNQNLSDIGPKLVPARKRQWKNLTFLHGLIDTEKDPEGDNLVLTRTDFGLAYLYDNWASRFVIQLFQEFTILFIGYSLDDPVMHYLVSAISAENHRKNDENRKNNQNSIKKHKLNSIYAFAGYKGDQENDKQNKKDKWESMGITPILYKVKRNKNHSLLYDTIKEWATLKRMDLSERKQWLKEQLKCNGEFPNKFQVSDRWKVKSVFSFLKVDEKLSEYFRQINPHISLLNLVSELPADEDDQKTSNIETKSQDKPKLLDNLVQPKTLIRKTESFALNTGVPIGEPLSKFENSIVLWLCKHLDKEELIHWVIEHGCTLNTSFKLHIRWILERLEIDKKQLTLSKSQHLFWKTIIDPNYFPIDNYNSNFLRLLSSLNEKYCPMKAQEFINLLEPYIEFEKPFYYKGILESNEFYRSEIKIHSGYYPQELKNEEMLLKHAEDFSDLLKKAMQKAEQFKIIQNGEDLFYIQRPSVADHGQNKDFYTWTYLIDLARDSFDLAMEKNKNLAKFLLYKWQQYPYSIFYRLILYAITKYESLDEQLAINLFKNNLILWTSTCKHEVLKYLRDKKHSKQAGKELIQLIMQGPPRHIFKTNVDDYLIKELKYKRLERLKVSGFQFSKETQDYYKHIQKEIQEHYKKIQNQYNLSDSIPTDDKEDFPVWHTGIRRRELTEYHSWTPEEIYNDIYTQSNIYSDTHIRQRDFQFLTEKAVNKAFEVLLIFEDKNVKATPYWESFFYGISSIKDISKRKEWLFNALKKIEKYDDQFIIECLEGLTDSMNSNFDLLYKNNMDTFKTWWKKLWGLSVANLKDSNTALNSNLGKISQSVFHVLWNKYKHLDEVPKGGKIPEDIKCYFKMIIADAKKTPFILYHFCVDLWLLWHLDREWILDNIKTLMDMKEHETLSKAIWMGYFHNPQLSPDFLSDFKQEFFELFLHRKEILSSDDNENEYYLENIAGVFFVATGGSWSQNIFSDTQIKQLKKKIDVDLLNPISRQIWRLLADSKDKSDHLWSDKIKPWIETFWPPQEKMKNNDIAQNFSLAVLYAGHQLRDTLQSLRQYIEGNIQVNNDVITYHINESCFDFDKDQSENRINEPHQLDSIFDYPEELLKLLHWNTPKKRAGLMIKKELKKILDEIKGKHPNVEQNEDYQTLRDKLE